MLPTSIFTPEAVPFVFSFAATVVFSYSLCLLSFTLFVFCPTFRFISLAQLPYSSLDL
jgi:hypothetical protein